MSSQTAQQLDRALEDVRSGTPIGEACRSFGVTEPTLLDWQRAVHGVEFEEPGNLEDARREIRRLRRLISSLTADKRALVEALVRVW